MQLLNTCSVSVSRRPLTLGSGQGSTSCFSWEPRGWQQLHLVSTCMVSVLKLRRSGGGERRSGRRPRECSCPSPVARRGGPGPQAAPSRRGWPCTLASPAPGRCGGGGCGPGPPDGAARCLGRDLAVDLPQLPLGAPLSSRAGSKSGTWTRAARGRQLTWPRRRIRPRSGSPSRWPCTPGK